MKRRIREDPTDLHNNIPGTVRLNKDNFITLNKRRRKVTVKKLKVNRGDQDAKKIVSQTELPKNVTASLITLCVPEMYFT